MAYIVKASEETPLFHTANYFQFEFISLFIVIFTFTKTSTFLYKDKGKHSLLPFTVIYSKGALMADNTCYGLFG